MKEKENIELYILRYLSGDILENEYDALMKWINKSPLNRQTFQEQCMLWNTLNPPFDPDKIDVAKAYHKTTAKITRKKQAIIHQILFYWQRIAAVAIIPLLVIMYYFYSITKNEQSLNDTVQHISAPHGLISQVDLPDGSKLWLNGGSKLSYPSFIGKKARKVQLDGEAYFEVKANKTNPFVVETKYATVTATGTAFNVEAYEKDSITAITMTEGVTNVSFGKAKEVNMVAGDRILHNKFTNQFEITQTDAYKWYAWKEGLLIFRNDPLSFVFKRIELKFNVEFILKDQSIAQSPYRATFEDESLPEILRLLEMTAPIQFKIHPKTEDKSDQFSITKIEVIKK